MSNLTYTLEVIFTCHINGKMSESYNLCYSTENDDFYKQFLNEDVQNNFAQSLSISDQVKKLGEGIDILSQELQKQVLSKHDDLLLQASHAAKLESVLNTMNTHVQCLLSNAERLRSQIVGPYSNIETHACVLDRLHQASHILRRVNRIQQLSKRLQATPDPVQQATTLQELEQLALDSDLSDVEAVSSELRSARSQRQKVIRLATSSLTQGISTRNVMQTTTALQIFVNLGIVKDATDNIVSAALTDCRESIRSSTEYAMPSVVSVKNKGAPGKANVLTTQGYKTKIWTAIEKAFTDEIFMYCKQMLFLQVILLELNAGETSNNFSKNFWDQLGDAIVDELNKTPASTQQIFDSEYPKLLKCYSEMTAKLNYNNYVYKSSLFEKWENAYLSNSLSKLLDPVHSMFNLENAPTQDQVDSLIRGMASELSMSLVEQNLTEKIAKNVGKSIKMFGVKTENQIVSGPETAQVIAGAPNGGQQLNVRLANILYYLQTQVSRMLSNMGDTLPSKAVILITQSIQSLTPLTEAILQPLVDSINKTIETIIVTIHMEQDWNRLQIPSNKTVPCSPYMRELTQFISRVFHTYLTCFNNHEILTTKCGEIAVRCIELFVRHSALLRPISAGGRYRLQSDYMFLENSLKVLCPHLSDLGRPYRLLKSMASIVTLQPEEITASQAVGSSVPHSTVLFLLFSYAGFELVSPHQTAGWSLTKLSAWLDDHPSEADRLEIIAGALQRYVTTVRKKNSTNYDPVYPIITTLLETANKAK